MCKTRDCDNAIKYKEAGLCDACYQYLLRWGKKTPTELFRRKRKLKLFNTRLNSVAMVETRARRRSG